MITIHTSVQIADNKTLDVEMHFDPEDPAAVYFTFENEDGSEVQWVFARDLLMEALEDKSSGYGDVSFTAKNPYVTMAFEYISGSGCVIFSYDIMKEFVELIYEEVPFGEDVYEIPEYIPEEWLV